MNVMRIGMAFQTQGDQVIFTVAAQLAAELDVVDLQVLHAAAHLTPPAVALQHLPM
jgi:hypothetical protein